MPRSTTARVVASVALLLAAVLVGLRWRSQRTNENPAIGRMFPMPTLVALPGVPPLRGDDLRAGDVTLVNLFASWCMPCRIEAPQLAALRAHGIAVAGIAVRDTPADVRTFLVATGTRYTRIGLDLHDRVQPALGSRGLPETWLVDGRGVVRARYRGDLHAADLPRVVAAVAAAR